MKIGLRLLALAILTISVFAIFKPEKVQAWIVWGYSWPSSTTVLHYRANELPSGDWQNRFSDARWQWNSAGADIDLYRNDTNYDIRVFDVPSLCCSYAGIATRYGWPDVSYAEIKHSAAWNWKTNGSNPSGNWVDLQSNMTHEIGHALAIAHTNASCWGNSRPTMCSGLEVKTTYKRTLENDDKNAVKYLFP